MSRVSHLVRAHGCHLGPRRLVNLYQSSSLFVSRVLGGDTHEQALDQAALGLHFGGLSLWKEAVLSAPAHLAPLIDAEPCVIHLLGLPREAGVDFPAVISIYDNGIIGAKEDCLTRLTPAKAPFHDIICKEAAEGAAERFDNILAGY